MDAPQAEQLVYVDNLVARITTPMLKNMVAEAIPEHVQTGTEFITRTSPHTAILRLLPNSDAVTISAILKGRYVLHRPIVFSHMPPDGVVTKNAVMHLQEQVAENHAAILARIAEIQDLNNRAHLDTRLQFNDSAKKERDVVKSLKDNIHGLGEKTVNAVRDGSAKNKGEMDKIIRIVTNIASGSLENRAIGLPDTPRSAILKDVIAAKDKVTVAQMERLKGLLHGYIEDNQGPSGNA